MVFCLHLEWLGFMFFSSIEALSLYVLIMALFRFKVMDYAWQAVTLVLLINVQSFILRNEFALSDLVPVISILMFVFFFAVVVRMPFVWAVLATILGYVIFAVIQTSIIVTVFGSITAIQTSVMNGYLLQLASAAVLLIISWVLKKRNLGFAFNMEVLRFKFEDFLVMIFIIIFIGAITLFLYLNQTWLTLLFFIVNAGFLLFYAIRKEKVHD